jgi:ketosteroid isomerase-like protein
MKINLQISLIMKKLLNCIKLTGILTVSFIFLQGCQNVRNEREITKLLQTDRAFSNMTSDKGIKRALADYADSNALVLKKDFKPIDAKDAAIKYFFSSSDSGVVFTWKPLGAEIADAGNMGYTYGIYKIESINSISKGTYITVWKKSTNGRWKLTPFMEKDIIGDRKELN